MTLTKAKLVDSIRKQAHLTKTRSTQIVDYLLEIKKKTLEDGEDVLTRILREREKGTERKLLG